MDVGRERSVTDLVEDGEEVILLGIWDRSEFEQAFAVFTALENFGFERDGAGGRGEDEPLADGNFAAGTDEGAPEVRADLFQNRLFSMTSIWPVGFSFSRTRVRRA